MRKGSRDDDADATGEKHRVDGGEQRARYARERRVGCCMSERRSRFNGRRGQVVKVARSSGFGVNEPNIKRSVGLPLGLAWRFVDEQPPASHARESRRMR